MTESHIIHDEARTFRLKLNAPAGEVEMYLTGEMANALLRQFLPATLGVNLGGAQPEPQVNDVAHVTTTGRRYSPKAAVCSYCGQPFVALKRDAKCCKKAECTKTARDLSNQRARARREAAKQAAEPTTDRNGFTATVEVGTGVVKGGVG